MIASIERTSSALAGVTAAGFAGSGCAAAPKVVRAPGTPASPRAAIAVESPSASRRFGEDRWSDITIHGPPCSLQSCSGPDCSLVRGTEAPTRPDLGLPRRNDHDILTT